MIQINPTLALYGGDPVRTTEFPKRQLFTEDEKGILNDEQLAPMNKARLIEGMKTFLMNSGKKKWTDTLHKIETSANKEDY